MLSAHFVVLAALLSPVAIAQSAPTILPGDGTLLEISAHGETTRTPDVAQVSAGVVTQSPDPSSALHANSERMAAVVTALKHAGVADRDIKTTRISLTPQYKYVPSQSPTITGYNVNNTVNVRLRDLTKVGDVLDALVKQGANQVNGPTFSVDKPDAALDEARNDAVKRAQVRADLYAAATGLKVRRIVNISEVPLPQSLLRSMGYAEAIGGSRDALSPPVAGGESSIGVDLNVVYELGH